MVRLLALLLLLAGCAQPGRPPVVDRSVPPATRPEIYTVGPADTLYSIAWRFELDYRALARANGIREPFTIFPGQRLRLVTQLAPGQRLGGAPPERKAAAPPERKAAAPPAPAAAETPAARTPAPPAWHWPARGQVLVDFGEGSPGVDFGLAPGASVRAAAAGEVVYAGNGLGGYQYLVILKHSPRYLSAYSLNDPPRVREGDRVKAQAILADIGRRGRTAAQLHFEIRKDGEPRNPSSVIGRAP